MQAQELKPHQRAATRKEKTTLAATATVSDGTAGTSLEEAESSTPTSKRQQNKSPDTSHSQAKLPHPTDQLPTAPRLMRVWVDRCLAEAHPTTIIERSGRSCVGSFAVAWQPPRHTLYWQVCVRKRVMCGVTLDSLLRAPGSNARLPASPSQGCASVLPSCCTCTSGSSIPRPVVSVPCSHCPHSLHPLWDCRSAANPLNQSTK